MTYLDLGNGTTARVHGDKPLTADGVEAMKDLMRAVQSFSHTEADVDRTIEAAGG